MQRASSAIGDLILPVILVVLVGACALCSVVMVIVRQLCQRRHRRKNRRGEEKPYKYETTKVVHNGGTLELHHGVMGVAETQNLPRNSYTAAESQSEEQRRRSRSQNQNRGVYVNEPKTRERQSSKSRSRRAPPHTSTTVPLKSRQNGVQSRSRGNSRNNGRDGRDDGRQRAGTNQFGAQLSNIAGANNVMMDDIIDEIDGRFGSPKYWKQLQSAHLSPKMGNSAAQYEKFGASENDRSETDDGDSDDSLMSKPRQHKYSTHTHTTHFHDEDEKLVRPPTAERDAKGDEKVSESYPYHNITNRQFAKLQNAITNAKTQSDFEKLEQIIKSGRIPELDWHGKGDAYNLVKRMASAKTLSTSKSVQSRVVGLGMGGASNSSIYRMSENSETVESQYANLPIMDKKRLMTLDEEELASKLARLRSGRASRGDGGGVHGHGHGQHRFGQQQYQTQHSGQRPVAISPPWRE